MVNLAKMHTPTPTPSDARTGNGARLVSLDGRTLPLKHARVEASASAGIARVVLKQTFANPHQERLAVKYLLPLPADGAVSGFSFRIGRRVITGEVDRKARARERFEEALVTGKTAALLEEDRDDLFTQEIGNIPPSTELEAEIIIDQPLIWLHEGSWEWRFPTVVGPRYMGEHGRVEDAEKITVDVANAPIATRIELALTIAEAIREGGRPESPSHVLEVSKRDRRTSIVLQSASGARLDRDLVVRWPVAKPSVGVTVECARPAAAEHDGKTYALFTLVPPAPEANAAALPRDLIFLIDTSGSMHGRPLDQSKRVIALMIDSLEDHDRLELIEFGSSPRRWQREPVVMTREGKKQAQKWVKELQSSGGTEMRAAVLEALRPLRTDAQRQIVLVTDGYVGFEREIVREVLDRLPRGSRLHTLGVGSGVNRTLTRSAARAGAGIEVVLGLDEDPERGAARMIARTARPVVTELVLEGEGIVDVVPRRLPDLFAGAPVMIAAALSPSARGVRVRGKTAGGTWEGKAEVEQLALGAGQQAVAALFARESVADREAHLAGGGDPHEIDRDIERIGLEFQIATRMTSWIAITEEKTVDPQGQLLREVMPHELPYGTSMEGLGLRGASLAVGSVAVGRAWSVEGAEEFDEHTAFDAGLVDDEDVVAPRRMSRAPSGVRGKIAPAAPSRSMSPPKEPEARPASTAKERLKAETKGRKISEVMPPQQAPLDPAPLSGSMASREDDAKEMQKRSAPLSPLTLAIFGVIMVAVILAIIAILWWGR